MSARRVVSISSSLLLLASLACGVGGAASPEEKKPTTAADEAAAEVTLEPSLPPPSPTPEPAVDTQPFAGPVPDGAIMRLGRGALGSLAVSPDGQLLAVGASIGVYFYAADSLTIVSYTPLPDLVEHVAFSHDGSLLAAATASSVYLLDTATGALVGERLSSINYDNGVAFSPDGSLVAATNGMGIKLYDVESGEELTELTGHTKEVGALVWTPDGSQIISGSTNDDRKQGEIFVWDAATGEILNQFGEEHTSIANKMTLSPDGSQLLTASYDEAIIWDAATGSLESILLEDYGIDSVAWSPDGQLIALGFAYPGAVRIFDASSGSELYAVEDQVGHIANVAFSPDSATLYSLNSYGTVFEREAASGEMLRSFEGYARRYGSVVWSPDGQTIWAGMEGSQVVHWNLDPPEILHQYTDYGGGGLLGFMVESMAFSPDNSLLAIGDLDGKVHLYDPATDEEVALFGDRDTGHRGAVTALGWSPDGSQLVTGSNDKTVIIWDVETQTPAVHYVDFAESMINGVAFAPAGDAVVVAGHDEFIYILDPVSGTVSNQWTPDRGTLAAMAWHPAEPNQFIVVIARGGLVIWDYQTGEEVQNLDVSGISGLPSAVAFNPAGTLIATGTTQGTLVLWDAASGERLTEFEEVHAARVTDVAFSPDGTQFASAAEDGTILIWPVP